MPLGILEYTHLPVVPGTAALEDLESTTDRPVNVSYTNLKCDKSGKIVLVPQPSDDANDPLNWPRWQKELFMVAGIWSVSCAGVMGPMLAPAYVQLAQTWGVSISLFTSANQGALVACLAGATPCANLLALRFGKRPVYVVASLGLAASQFWGSAATSFASFVASRAISGLFTAPFEALLPASIADIWFVHERGAKMGLYNLAFLAGSTLGPLIAGQLIEHCSWRVASYAMAGALTLNAVFTILFMHETAFDRTVKAIPIHSSLQEREKADVCVELNETAVSTELESHPGSPSNDSACKLFLQRLAFWSGYKGSLSPWKSLAAPFRMLPSLIVIWSSVNYMMGITFYVIISVTASQIFHAPPYNFSVGAVGNTYLSPFVASLLGMAIAGPAIDGGVKFLARKNGGVFEPEFRLPVFISSLLFTATGFFTAGQSLGVGMSWAVPVIAGFGLLTFGIMLSLTVALAYILDCHRDQAEASVSMMTIMKHMSAFGSFFYINPWLEARGAREVFFVLGGIAAGLGVSVIPMYVFGKKVRGFTARHGLVA